MADSRQVRGVNPLRPYYVPPLAGDAAAASSAAAAAATTTTSTPTASAFTFPDIDYSDYMPEASPSVTSSIKKLLDQAVWKYSTVLMAQPLEVGKLILQVRVAGDEDEDEADVDEQGYFYDEDEEDEEYYNSYEDEDDNDNEDEPNLFTSTPMRPSRNLVPPPSRGRRGRRRQRPSKRPGSAAAALPDGRIELKNSDSLLDALSSLASSTGALSMWRGTNATVIYSVLSRTLEPFLRSFLAALAGVAEPDLILPLSSVSALADSAVGLSWSAPIPAVIISTAACALTSLILAPIDTARTRLILTAEEPRSLLGVLRTLSPAWLIPSHLVPITLLSSTLPNLVAHASPFFFHSYLHLDPHTTPASWSIATFTASALDLCLKLPLETVLRRAQIATWTAPSPSPSPTSKSVSTCTPEPKCLATIVRVPQSYRGILATMWGIVREEGYSESQKDKLAHLAGRAPRRRRRGQGIDGLYRGWRVGLWGLVGVWGNSFVGGVSAAQALDAGAAGGKF